MCSLWWLVALWRWPRPGPLHPSTNPIPPPQHHRHHHRHDHTPGPLLPPLTPGVCWVALPPHLTPTHLTPPHLTFPPSPPLPTLTVSALTQIWGVRGSEGLDDGDVGGGEACGAFIWETMTFLCALGQGAPPPCCPSPSPSSCPSASPPPTLRHPAHSPVGTRPLVGWPRAVAVTLALAVKGGGPNLPQRRSLSLGFSLTSVLAAWSGGSKELLTHKKLLVVFFCFVFFVNIIYIGTKCVVLLKFT